MAFKVQHNADRSDARYEGQFIGKGDSQIQDLVFNVTFATGTRSDNLRLILVVSTHLGLDIDQLAIE